MYSRHGRGGIILEKFGREEEDMLLQIPTGFQFRKRV